MFFALIFLLGASYKLEYNARLLLKISNLVKVCLDSLLCVISSLAARGKVSIKPFGLSNYRLQFVGKGHLYILIILKCKDHKMINI